MAFSASQMCLHRLSKCVVRSAFVYKLCKQHFNVGVSHIATMCSCVGGVKRGGDEGHFLWSVTQNAIPSPQTKISAVI